MAQFDLYINSNLATKQRVPFLLDIQNDLLSELSTRLVIPLVTATPALTKLNPIVTVANQELIVSTIEMAAISVKLLKNKIDSLADKRQEILDAIDFLVVGF